LIEGRQRITLREILDETGESVSILEIDPELPRSTRENEKYLLQLAQLQNQVKSLTTPLRDGLLTTAEILRRREPLTTALCGIYFLIKEDVIVYIGQSVNIMSRVHTHRYESIKEFDSFSYLLCRKDELDILEAKYILSYLPLYNGDDNSDRLGLRVSRTDPRIA
jgi:hypothetical protein